MRDQDLVSIIRSHRKEALGYHDGHLSNERSTAMDHYHGRPYGNEQEGRSAVVSRDLSEAVSWALPSILDVFTKSGNIAEFEPVGPEDEEQASIQSDLVNKVFMQDASGKMVLHDAFWDALVLKNGYIKHFWEEKEETETTQYEGLTGEELGILFTDLENEGATVIVEGQEEKTVVIETPTGQQPIQVFDVKLKVTRKCGKVVCVPVPPEELRVSKKSRGPLAETDFIEHVTRKTRSDLIKMGMKRDFVDSLPAFTEYDNDQEVFSRDTVSDESNDFGTAFSDRSMDDLEYCEAYLRVDFDGDGIAELRKVVTVSDRIPPGDEWNEEIDSIPISGGVPKRIPHRHVGESLDDDLADLQEIKTTLIRQMLDNIYATNQNQWLVNERVNLKDFLQSLPGGVKRVRGLEPIAGAVEPVQTTPIMNQIMPAIDYIDGTKESRTGISRASTGIDPDVLRQSTKGAYMENMNRASRKVEMFAWMLAETLVKPTLLAVHSLLIKHQNKPLVTQLRGKFVTVNPQEWKRRTDMVLKVGIGTGNEEEKRQKIMMLAQAQQALAVTGLVGPMQAYNLFADFSRSLGFEMPEKYAMSPESPEYQQKMQNPQPNPEMMKIMAQQQADVQKFQAQVEMEKEKQQAQVQAAIMEQQAQMEQKDKELMLMTQRDREKAELDAQLENMKIQQELVLSQQKLEFDKWKTQLEADTKILIAQMNAEIDARKQEQEALKADRESAIQAQMHKEKIDAMTRAKTIVRDENGRPAGIQ